MIQLTRLDGSALWLNVSSISLVEETPTTVIRLREGEVVRVKERAAEIVSKMADARADVVARGVARALERDGQGASWECSLVPADAI